MFKSELSFDLIEKAKRDLNKDETRKEQSLVQAREWCMKHPFIKVSDQNVLTDEMLIPFLRAKKYTMEKVYESIEKATLFIKHHESWSDWRGENLRRALDLYDSGNVVVLKNCDFEGRRIILCQNQFDMIKFNADDIFRLHVLLFTSLHNEEATKISGANFIDNFSEGITMNYLSMFPLKHVYEFAVQLKSTPLRLQHILIVGLPSFATNVMKLVKHAFTDTMKKRLHVLNDISEVSNYVDASLLPRELGGEIPMSEMLDDFKPWMIYCAEKMSSFFDHIDVDFNKVDAFKDQCGFEQMGSFRKLNIE